eukprot:1027960-Amphidinium_carterae.1
MAFRDEETELTSGIVSQLVDRKLIGRPQKLTTNTVWSDWIFEFENYLVCVDANYQEELRQAAIHGGPVGLPTEPNRQARSHSLYAVLASLVTGKALDIVKTQRDLRKGFESWRRIVHEYEPPNNSRRLALLAELLEAASLDGTSRPEQFAVKLLRWEERIREYERFPDCTFDAEKKAILLKRAPAELATFLRVTVSETSTYEEIRDRVEGYLRSRRLWHLGDTAASSQGPVPMDVGAIGTTPKGKGKDKGKDQRKGKQKSFPPAPAENASKQCLCCGRTGHVKADCYHKESYCSICGKQGHLAKMCKQRESKGKSKGKQKGKDKGKGHPVHGVEAAAVAEEINAGVIMGISCETPDDNVVASIEDSSSLMCDSGAMRNVITPGAFANVPVQQQLCPPRLHSITGEQIKVHGFKNLCSQIIGGAQVNVRAHVSDVRKNALSLAEVVDSGFTIVLNRDHSYITPEIPPEPKSDALQHLQRQRGL